MLEERTAPETQYIAGRQATMREDLLTALLSGEADLGDRPDVMAALADEQDSLLQNAFATERLEDHAERVKWYEGATMDRWGNDEILPDRYDLEEALEMERATPASSRPNARGVKEAFKSRPDAPNWVRGSRAPVPTGSALARIPGHEYLGTKGVSKLGKWAKFGKLGSRALGGGIAGLSIYAILEAMDQFSGAARKREAFTPDAWASRMGGAAELRGAMDERISMRGEAGQLEHLAGRSEQENRFTGMRHRAFQQHLMGPSKRSQDKLEELLGSDIETVKQVSQKSPPSFPEFMASEGIL